MKKNEEMCKKIKDLPEVFDTLKKVFGRNNVPFDIVRQEIAYI